MFKFKKILMFIYLIIGLTFFISPIFWTNISLWAWDSSYQCEDWKSASECKYQLRDIFQDKTWSSSSTTLQNITSSIIKLITTSAAAIAVLCIIIWWYMVMMPWDAKQSAKWKTIIINTIIWIMIIYWAYAIISFVQSILYSF